jgi:hypothetical protein
MAKESGTTDQELPPKPREPDMSECCQRSCDNCVFVYYEKALDRWRKKVEKLKAHISDNYGAS